jgi:hypothetical protein
MLIAATLSATSLSVYAASDSPSTATATTTPAVTPAAAATNPSSSAATVAPSTSGAAAQAPQPVPLEQHALCNVQLPIFDSATGRATVDPLTHLPKLQIMNFTLATGLKTEKQIVVVDKAGGGTLISYESSQDRDESMRQHPNYALLASLVPNTKAGTIILEASSGLNQFTRVSSTNSVMWQDAVESTSVQCSLIEKSPQKPMPSLSYGDEPALDCSANVSVLNPETRIYQDVQAFNGRLPISKILLVSKAGVGIVIDPVNQELPMRPIEVGAVIQMTLTSVEDSISILGTRDPHMTNQTMAIAKSSVSWYEPLNRITVSCNAPTAH